MSPIERVPAACFADAVAKIADDGALISCNAPMTAWLGADRTCLVTLPLDEDQRVELAEGVIFRDPLLVVRGRTRVIKMFKNLNRLYPNSQILKFDSIDPNDHAFELVIQYRRWLKSPGNQFQTALHFAFFDGQIVSITEEWQHPLAWSARKGSQLTELFRSGLGRLLS